MKIKTLHTTVLAATAALFTAGSAMAQEGDVVIFDWSGYDDPEFHTQYTATHGGSPTFAFFGDEEEAFQKIRAGFAADVAHPCSQSVTRWRDAGIIKPMDPARIDSWETLIPGLRDMPGFNDENGVYFVPADWGNTAVTYRTDLVEESSIASLQAFADPAFMGKISVGDNVDDAYALGFLAVGVTDWTTATDEQFQAASDFLRKVHQNVLYYWQDGPTLAQSMASGEVTLAWAWNETSVTMQAEGHPVAMKRDTAEGLSTWVCGYSLLNGGEGSEDKAYDYINAFLSEYSANYLVTAWGYGHSNQAGLDKVDPATLESMGYSNLEAFRAKTLWQAPMPAELREKMIAEFEQIKAGF